MYDVLNAGPRNRFQAKYLIVSNCGYGAGGKKLSDQAVSMGIDLVASGTTGPQVVEQYRDSFPRIAGVIGGEYKGHPYRVGGVWKDIEAAFKAAMTGATSYAATCRFSPFGRGVLVTLPSGRSLCYRQTRMENRITQFSDEPRPCIVFMSNRDHSVGTYGGKLTENIVQAIARDLLCHAMVQMDAEGMKIVLHVHDEVVVECHKHRSADTIQRMTEIMSTPPSWAEGLPLGASGHVGRRYVK